MQVHSGSPRVGAARFSGSTMTHIVLAAPCCLPLFLLAEPIHVQSPISTDRPGLLFSPLLVPPHRFQIEAGLPGVAWNQIGDARATTIGTPLQLRYGLCNQLELRLLTTPFNFVDGRAAGSEFDESGFGDLELGGKFALRDGRSGGLRAAAIAGVRLPTGEDSFSTGREAYSLNLAAGCDLAPGTALTTLAGLARTPSGNEDAWVGTLGAQLSRSFDESWTGYGELVQYSGIENARDQSFAGLGLTWLFDDNLQLDIGFDFGLNEAATDLQGALGLSWRF